MKKLTNLFRKLPLRQILTVFLAGVLLFVSTACNSGDQLGARPDNPPVQAGGANNPHKGGGDGYTQYKMSTDPSVNSNTAKPGHASSQLISHQLIAANASELLYPGSGVTNTKFPEIAPGSKQTLNPSEQLPAQRQPSIERSDPNAKILERVGEAFKDAGSFLNDKADEAGARPEMQANPARN